MQQEILDTLFGDRDVLTDLIIKLSPTNLAEQKQLENLMMRRDRLSMVIQDVINSDIVMSTPGIDAAVQQLDAASAELGGLAKTFEEVVGAISLADQLVKVATSLVLAAATP